MKPQNVRESSVRSRPDIAPDDPLDVRRSGLSPRSRSVSFAVAEALLSDEDARGRVVAASSELCERAVLGLDRAIGAASADIRRGFWVLTWLIQWLPLLVIGAASRMSRLPIARRVAYLEALEESRIGLLSMLLVAFKVPLCIPAFEEGDELRLSGYERPTATSRRLPLLPDDAVETAKTAS